MANYLTTYTGEHINPINPEIEKIHIEDIAHALSLICRGNGQTTHFYSVAQHCINCCKEANARGYNERIQLICLLHDASEAYMADLIRPIKVYMNGYQEIEERFLKVVLNKFGVGDYTDKEWKNVKEIDDDLLIYDLVELLKEPMPEKGYQFVLVPDISFKPFKEVEDEYKKIAFELIKKIKGGL